MVCCICYLLWLSLLLCVQVDKGGGDQDTADAEMMNDHAAVVAAAVDDRR